ncbi:MAG: molybdopterin molybdotransferase MoeA, partial [Bacteroidetes bacterium]|nr:molybdopterin molybdotransferase MoeA [Bacteroidota bacterium]
GTAVRIMTGAPMPPSADAVAEFEVVDRNGDEIVLRRPIDLDRNVRHAGEDVRQGESVLTPGTVLRPAGIGVLASLGRTRVKVVRRPRVAILSTGDEVAAPGEELRPGQIYDANGYSVAAQTIRCGGEPIFLGVARDRREELANKLAEGLAAGADLLITSGGVSMGDFDMVKDVLATEGRMEFWLVRMKPGKPLAFGFVRGVPLIGLPGNPVSAMVSFEMFGRPSIMKMAGRTAFARPHVEARLVEGLRRKDGRRHYLRVTVSRTDDGWEARLTGDQGSGILTSMARANGLAVVSEEQSWLAPGATVPVILLDTPEGR